MALIERTAYPRFGRNPTAEELTRLYTPALREIDLAKRSTRGSESQQLAFLVMLKSFQRLGYFPGPEEVPEMVVAHLRSRLGLADNTRATSPARSRQRYRDAIRKHLGVKPFEKDARRLAAAAVAEAATTMDDPAGLLNVAIEELVKERFELPAFSTLDRLVRHTRYAVNSPLFSRVDARMTDAMTSSLGALLRTGFESEVRPEPAQGGPQERHQEELLRDARAAHVVAVPRGDGRPPRRHPERKGRTPLSPGQGTGRLGTQGFRPTASPSDTRLPAPPLEVRLPRQPL